jgi:hypothetical protein
VTRYLHTNNASSNLRTAINAATSTIQVTAGQGVLFPNPVTGDGFFVTVEDRRIGRSEIMLCTARSSDTMTVTRGQQGTVPQSFSVGVNVSNRLTAQVLNEFVDQTIGVFDISRIPPIPDSSLTTVNSTRLFGTINSLRLPDIPRAKITSVDAGTLDIGRIPAARLPLPIPAANLPEIPPENLTAIPSANLTGLIPLNNIPILPSGKIETLAGSKITGTVPNAVMNVSYTNLVSLVGSGSSSFTKQFADAGSGTSPGFAFNVATNAGMGYNATIGPYIAFADAARFSVNDNDIAALGGAAFKGPATGLTSIPGANITGNIPVGQIRNAMNGGTGTAPLFAVRAWVRANISGGVATVTDHGNIPTVSAQGAGVFRCLFSIPMSGVSYCVVAMSEIGTTAKVTSYATGYVDIDVGGASRLNVMVIQ